VSVASFFRRMLNTYHFCDACMFNKALYIILGICFQWCDLRRVRCSIAFRRWRCDVVMFFLEGDSESIYVVYSFEQKF
jgi:hypothetical protein